MPPTTGRDPRLSPAGVARHLAGRPWLRQLGGRLAPIDHRLSRAGGRTSLLELAGLPLLRVRVPRRSGTEAVGVVVGVRYGEQWLIGGGDDGRPVDHKPTWPAWASALRSVQSATMEHRGIARQVRVHRATPAERERWWPILVRAWPAYDVADREAVEQWDVWLLTPLGE